MWHGIVLVFVEQRGTFGPERPFAKADLLPCSFAKAVICEVCGKSSYERLDSEPSDLFPFVVSHFPYTPRAVYSRKIRGFFCVATNNKLETNLLMNILRGLKSKKSSSAVDLLQQISKRAEDLTPEEQAKSFVAIRRIDGALKNRDSRVLFGRRGTGKTHILSYVASSARTAGDVACVIDLRALGSNNSIYADQSLEPSVRATRLVRDLISAIHDRLLDQYTDPKSPFRGNGLDRSIDALSASVKTVVVSETQETRIRTASSEAASIASGVGADISATGPKLSTHANANLEREDQAEWEIATRGSPRPC
jgi:hypothetical protein